MPATTFNQMYRLSGEVMCPEADVLFVSCTGLGVADGIPMLERDFGVPVVTSNQASLWCAPARTLHPGRRGPGRAVPALMRQTCVSAAARQWGRRSASPLAEKSA